MAPLRAWICDADLGQLDVFDISKRILMDVAFRLMYILDCYCSLYVLFKCIRVINWTFKRKINV